VNVCASIVSDPPHTSELLERSNEIGGYRISLDRFDCRSAHSDRRSATTDRRSPIID